uniref:Uncharacterized protein n=1 Tax=Timema genevievae TaxID=629358 RepID=A0A7R9JS72_TIMGE|nr:unnamed protein product [Timema genevievae]
MEYVKANVLESIHSFKAYLLKTLNTAWSRRRRLSETCSQPVTQLRHYACLHHKPISRHWNCLRLIKKGVLRRQSRKLLSVSSRRKTRSPSTWGRGILRCCTKPLGDIPEAFLHDCHRVLQGLYMGYYVAVHGLPWVSVSVGRPLRPRV